VCIRESVCVGERKREKINHTVWFRARVVVCVVSVRERERGERERERREREREREMIRNGIP